MISIKILQNISQRICIFLKFAKFFNIFIQKNIICEMEKRAKLKEKKTKQIIPSLKLNFFLNLVITLLQNPNFSYFFHEIDFKIGKKTSAMDQRH